jgi:hypothetical protein
MKWLLSLHWLLVASIWYFGNGLLHDIFIFIRHKGKYDRDFLYLLQTGHILMLSGAVLFVCYLMMINKIQCGGLIAIIIAIGMLIYCAMIFPFLKSFGTISISILIIIVSIKAMYSFPDIYEIMKKYK